MDNLNKERHNTLPYVTKISPGYMCDTDNVERAPTCPLANEEAKINLFWSFEYFLLLDVGVDLKCSVCFHFVK